jgi:hypothetical protein
MSLTGRPEGEYRSAKHEGGPVRPDVDRRRRAFVGGFVALGAALPVLPLAAQDIQGIAAQKAARDWLQLTDNGDAEASWNAAGTPFRDATPLDGWGGALKQVRVPLGALSARTVASTRFEKSIPGFPPGDYAIVEFRTAFAKRSTSHETLTLQREAGGVWRVVGYLIA